MSERVARTVNRYEILDELGVGGMATVYRARQIDLDRIVALKELSGLRQADRTATHRFLRESRLTGSLSHPNIVTVHDYFESDGVPYIAMEYVPGGSLRPSIGHLSLTQVAGVLEDILSALAHAERNGIVHRDLKPENVLITAEGRSKVADFGIAKATGAAARNSVLTVVGSTIGTPQYMAPEQAMGKELGPWTDLYSLGIMTFELLSGRTPFEDTDDPMAVLMRQVNDPVPPVRSINPEVDVAMSDWIAALLTKDPRERIRSAEAAWEQCEEIVMELAGPRWRRAARIVPPSQRPTDAPPGPHTTPPTSAARPPLMSGLEIPGAPPADLHGTRRPSRELRALSPTVLPHTAPTLRDDEPAGPGAPPRRTHRARRLVVGAVAAVIVAAALFAGRGADPGGPGTASGPATAADSVEPARASVVGRHLSLRVPEGWARRRRVPDLGLRLERGLAVSPRRGAARPLVEFGVVAGRSASNAALLPDAFTGTAGEAGGAVPRRSAVRLPEQGLQAWRYDGLRAVGTDRDLTIYAVPTTAGVATVACAVPAGRGAAFADQCAALAGTLRLRRAKAYPLGPSPAYARALGAATKTVREVEAAQGPKLSAASTAAGQAAAARTIASAYGAAATQLASLRVSPADARANRRLVAALRRAADGHRRAARAAAAGAGDRYLVATAAIPAARAGVDEALAALEGLGYDATGTAPESADTTGAPQAAPPRSAPHKRPEASPPPDEDAESGVGDSRSDDPSDDEEDEEGEEP